MKNILFFTLILICFEAKSQTYNELIGSTFSNGSKITAFDTLINHGAGIIPGSRLVLRKFIESSRNTYYLVLELEDTSTRSFSILDIIQFDNIGDSATIVVGIYDTAVLNSDTLGSGYIIAYECCHDLSNADWQDNPQTPIKAWYTDNNKKFVEINPELVLREYAYVIFKEN